MRTRRSESCSLSCSLRGLGPARTGAAGIDGRVQQRAPSRHQPGAPVTKVLDQQVQPVNSVRDLLSSFETGIRGDSRRSRTPRWQVVACSRSAGKCLLFQPRCLHEMERAAPSYPPLVEVWRRSPNDFVPGTLAFAPIRLASPRNLRPTGAGRMPPNMRCDRWVTWCHNSPTEGTTNPRRRDATSRPLSERRAFQEPGHADRTRSKKRSRDDRGRVRAYCRRYLSGEISSE